MYFVIELQTNQDGSAANIVTQHTDKNQALSKYHEILHYAAISELPVHTAAVLDEQGRQIAREAFVRLMPETAPEE